MSWVLGQVSNNSGLELTFPCRFAERTSKCTVSERFQKETKDSFFQKAFLSFLICFVEYELFFPVISVIVPLL